MQSRKSRSAASRKKKILLLLPCTNKKPYTEAPSWKFVMSRIDTWAERVDLAAVDCITNPTTNRPYGIVTKRQQHLTVDKDERPDPAKLPELTAEIRKKLDRLAPRYSHVVSYLNVRSYWDAIAEVKGEFDIEMLPSVYRRNKVWNSKKLHSGPIGIFRREVPELQSVLAKHTGIKNGHPATA